jgi:selenide,water dikinase
VGGAGLPGGAGGTRCAAGGTRYFAGPRGRWGSTRCAAGARGRGCRGPARADRTRCGSYDPDVATRPDPPPIRLTELTECGGCAAKLGADLLADALAGLGAEPGTAMAASGAEPGTAIGASGAEAGASGAEPPGPAAGERLLAGLEPPDDAAAYLVAPDLAVLGTLDFFPPLVDDPRAFGEIAAANALSDVFAMGGRVLFALSIAAFPEDFPPDALTTILRAAAGKVREAGGVLAGGHTIRDPEPKYGLAVIGVAHPDRLFRKGGARPGDALLLTKRLGTGLLVSGRRQGRTSDAYLDAAIAQMRALNRAASEVFARHDVRGATDVTGFGLLGHGLEMARASGAALVFEAAALPALDGALDLARAGVETGGAGHNRRFTAPALTVGEHVPPELVALAHDPQTSGGLLATVPAHAVEAVEADLAAAGMAAWRIGGVERGSGVGLV